MTKPMTLEEMEQWDAEMFGIMRGTRMPDIPRLFSSYRLALAVVEAAKRYDGGQCLDFVRADPRHSKECKQCKLHDALAAFDKGDKPCNT